MEQSEQQVSDIIPPVSSSRSSLYVGDLDHNVRETDVYELFSRIGPVVSVKVCRNQSAKGPLCYAYVNYTSPKDAYQAINDLNFSMLNGKPMRIMYLNRDPTLRKSGAANIFIKNLDPLVDSKILHDKFSVFGPILSCRVATNTAGDSKGFGFVQFEQEEAASNAIDKANGMTIYEKQIFVGPFVKKEERDSTSKFNNLYVKNFTDVMTNEDLCRIFGEFGPITSAVVMRDSKGNSKCFGFVNFENADDALKAVECLNGRKIDEKEWYVGRAQKKSERELELREKYEHMQKDRLEKNKDVNLYLKNIDTNIDVGTLRDLFLPYGTVTSCKIMRSPDGQSKGVGFVTYSSPEEARKAINEMNGKMVGSKPLYVARAHRKEERQARDAMLNMPPHITINPYVYHPGPPPLLGQQFYYGQPHPGLIPQQPNGFGYHHSVVPGMGPGPLPIQPNCFMPPVPRPGLQGPRMGKRTTGPPAPPPLLQQQVPARSSNRSMRYSQTPTNPSDSESSEAGGTSTGPTMIENTLCSTMTPEQQRSMLGEKLYPLVDQLEHDRAGKVTGMLLELDLAEILHLIKSPEALRAKVGEAMNVLRLVQAGVDLSSLSVNEAVES